MKRFLGITVLSLLVFVGCEQTTDAIAGFFEPIIGTWESTILGVTTTLVFNADETCTETITIAGVGDTKNGTWDANDSTITRSFSDGTSDTLYYSFNSDKDELTLSSSPGGLSVTYTEQ